MSILGNSRYLGHKPQKEYLALANSDQVADPGSKRLLGRSPSMDGHCTADTTSVAPPAPTKVGVIYTCPMHPQIRQDGPGNCPICGMTLEPVKATAEVVENRELTDMTRRFWVGLVLARFSHRISE